MPLPKLKFSKETIVSMAANHGEKVLAVLAVLCSLPLAWGGVNALRTRMLDPEKSPAQIKNAASEAENQFNRALTDEQRARLAENIRGPSVDAVAVAEAWRISELDNAPSGLGLNRPLLGDIKKREAPTVFPLEQLQAVAGVAAIARRQQDQQLAGMGNPGFSGEPGAGGEAMGAAGPLVQSPPAKQLPYVLLTGLIPAKRQLDEFRNRYATATFTDPQRDVPRWSSFKVERQDVGSTGEGPWETIDLRRAVQRWGGIWAGVSAESLPPTLSLSDAENPRDPAIMPIGFLGPLPQLAERPRFMGAAGGVGEVGGPGGSGAAWGLVGLHPWIVDELETLQQQQAAEAEQQGAMMAQPFADGGMPSVGGVSSLPGGAPFSGGFPGQSGMEASFDDPMSFSDGADGSNAMLNPHEYRLFRFLDTNVEPGKVYRYRVTIAVWNPNVGLPIRYLDEPALAEAVTLDASPVEIDQAPGGGAIRVPGRSRVLARLLSRDAKKLAGLGGRDNEALVLDANPDSENFELHSAEIKLGQPIGIKEGARRIKLGNRRISIPEHDVETDLTVLGIVGEQELDEKKRISRGFVPPPPFELLLVDSEGIIQQVTPSESAATFKQYRQTLPGYTPPRPVEATMESGF